MIEEKRRWPGAKRIQSKLKKAISWVDALGPGRFIQGVLPAPYCGEMCPWLVIDVAEVGIEVADLMAIPLLCPVCGKPIHIGYDHISDFSQEVGGFEISSILYIDPNSTGPVMHQLNNDDGPLEDMMFMELVSDPDNIITADAMINLLKTLDPDTPISGHLTEDHNFPRFVLSLARYEIGGDDTSDDDEPIDAIWLKIHPMSLLGIRFLTNTRR